MIELLSLRDKIITSFCSHAWFQLCCLSGLSWISVTFLTLKGHLYPGSTATFLRLPKTGFVPCNQKPHELQAGVTQVLGYQCSKVMLPQNPGWLNSLVEEVLDNLSAPWSEKKTHRMERRQRRTDGNCLWHMEVWDLQLCLKHTTRKRKGLIKGETGKVDQELR